MSCMVFVTFLRLSAVEVCADYGGVNVFHCVLILASSMVLGFVSYLWCSLCCCMLFVSYIWVLFVVL